MGTLYGHFNCKRKPLRIMFARWLFISLLLSVNTGCIANTAAPHASPSAPPTLPLIPASATTPSTKTLVAEAFITSTPTLFPTLAPETPEKIKETDMPVSEPLTITIVYDNNPYDERLRTAWGFSALVEYHDHTLLFDTGGEGITLLDNMNALGFDPTQIQSVVLSHAHSDHTGGLSALLECDARPVVYMLASFPLYFKSEVSRITEAVAVSPGMLITEDIYTTGEIGQTTPEQALVIRSQSGLVILTGCAHPGIVEIVEQAHEMFDEPIYLVMGGFHLSNKSAPEIQTIIEELRRLEVHRVAPCHCTGENATAMFSAEYGEDFIQAGAGKVIQVDN